MCVSNFNMLKYIMLYHVNNGGGGGAGGVQSCEISLQEHTRQQRRNHNRGRRELVTTRGLEVARAHSETCMCTGRVKYASGSLRPSPAAAHTQNGDLLPAARQAPGRCDTWQLLCFAGQPQVTIVSVALHWEAELQF